MRGSTGWNNKQSCGSPCRTVGFAKDTHPTGESLRSLNGDEPTTGNGRTVNVPKLFYRRPNTSVERAKQRKKDIKLEDFGVTLDQYKADLERGISYGYRPHFGYPSIRFDSIREGLSALNLED